MRKLLLLIVIAILIPSGAYCGKPAECNEMEPLFSTGDWAKGKFDENYSCLGSIFYPDKTQFFYTVTSIQGSETVERYNFAVIFSSMDKCKKMADILRLMDKVSILLKAKTGKVAPEYLVKAALDMRDGEYFVENKRVSISTKSHVTDLSVSLWK